MGKWLISLIAFLIWAGISEWTYLCTVTGVICPTESVEVEEEVPSPPPIVETERAIAPIMFNWNDPLAVKTDRFTKNFEEYILRSNSPDSILEITGFYAPNEVNDTKYRNLGVARAARIAELFPDIPNDRIELLSKKVNRLSSDPGHSFEFSEMRWVANTDGSDNTTTKVVALSDREYIYFPYNSSDRITSPQLEEYLKELANYLKDAGGKVKLTGHTDDKGEEAYNEKLARSRANDVKALLLQLGVPSSQIEVHSMGEREPIASNATDKGRARNRRVEVVRSK